MQKRANSLEIDAKQTVNYKIQYYIFSGSHFKEKILILDGAVMTIAISNHILYHSDGRIKYEGGWKDNKENGHGRQYDDKGNLIYEGDFLNGLMHGKGVHYFSDGRVAYEGELKSGKYHGLGKIYDGEKNCLAYEGTFKDGVFNGKGIHYYVNGNIAYEGEFINGRYEGFGKKSDYDGKLIYEGWFLAGERKLDVTNRVRKQKAFSNVKMVFIGISIFVLILIVKQLFTVFPDNKGIVIFIAIIVGAGILSRFNTKDLKGKYQKALDALSQNSHNVQLRNEALKLGREYYASMRDDNRVTLYDETAINNDLKAASGN